MTYHLRSHYTRSKLQLANTNKTSLESQHVASFRFLSFEAHKLQASVAVKKRNFNINDSHCHCYFLCCGQVK
ncbi:hypothetical protein L1987_66274 [Smallanthus sonchifolius]|uniref:Uncharacterized protein n=1 Tax=Smallanthus sonchifolius TaxID=185202 RepID=A0ACB9BX06_9ASTR|nr:hypothetical protein L1987_66274 [Smallanthus sonchifolius]